jgi:hypothetical protein
MALWWATAIGFVIVLGCLGGTFVHFLNTALDKDDSKRIDKIKQESEESVLSQGDQ